jgi:hypothetical protein
MGSMASAIALDDLPGGLVPSVSPSVDTQNRPVVDTCEPASRRASLWGESPALASICSFWHHSQLAGLDMSMTGRIEGVH